MNGPPESQLLPHQLRLVEEFSRLGGPRAVALDAPPGTGSSDALMSIARNRAATGRLVVVVVPRVLLEQWQEELKRFGVEPTAVYRAPADVRMTWDTVDRPWPSTGIVLIATPAMRAPLVEKAIRTVSPSLLIVDDERIPPNSRLGHVLTAVAAKAEQVIARTSTESIPWYPSAELRRWEYPLVDNSGNTFGPTFRVRIHDYPASADEAELVRESQHLLGAMGFPVPFAGLTRPAIQSSLLGAVRRLEAPDQLELWEEGQLELNPEEGRRTEVDPQAVNALWRILDLFDELPEDGRLTAVLQEVAAGVDAQRSVIVVAERLRELQYLSAALADAGIRATSVSGQDSPDHRAASLERLQEGGVLLATPIFFDVAVRLPDRSLNIWYSTPRRFQQARNRVGIGPTTRDVEIVLIRATPPITVADSDVADLYESLRGMWKQGPTP